MSFALLIYLINKIAYTLYPRNCRVAFFIVQGFISLIFIFIIIFDLYFTFLDISITPYINNTDLESVSSLNITERSINSNIINLNLFENSDNSNLEAYLDSYIITLGSISIFIF